MANEYTEQSIWHTCLEDTKKQGREYRSPIRGVGLDSRYSGINNHHSLFNCTSSPTLSLPGR